MNNNEFSIVTADASDKERINELFMEMLRSIYGTEDVKGFEDGYPDRFFRGGENIIFAAKAGGEIVGFLSVEVHREQQDYIYLEDFSVSASHRSRGIGTALIDRAERYAWQLGIDAVLLHVERSNTAALRLYERLGYSVFRDDGNRLLLLKNIS